MCQTTKATRPTLSATLLPPPQRLNYEAEPYQPRMRTANFVVVQPAWPPQMVLPFLNLKPYIPLYRQYSQPFGPVYVPYRPNFESYGTLPYHVSVMQANPSSDQVPAESYDVGNSSVSDLEDKLIDESWKGKVGSGSRRPQNRFPCYRGRDRCWRPVEKDVETRNGDAARVDGASGEDDGDAALQGITTLMIRNIPNRLERVDLLGLLDSHCREINLGAESSSDGIKSAYDFLYLPMEFAVGVRANLGYAFVNFTTAEAAVRFRKAFHNYEWKGQDSSVNKKICRITAANIQGQAALCENFRNSRFQCDSPDYLPVTLSPPSDGSVDATCSPIGHLVGGDSRRYRRRKAMLRVKRQLLRA